MIDSYVPEEHADMGDREQVLYQWFTILRRLLDDRPLTENGE